MNIRESTIKTLSTFFYVGYLPLIPGTFASIIGIFLYYLIRSSTSIHILFTLGLIASGFYLGSRAEEIFKRKDAPCIVIDEIAGMLLSLLFLPDNIKLVILAFILFRILDIFKPYPADKLQSAGGSIGIMADDIVAGLYTNIILQVALRFASFKTS